MIKFHASASSVISWKSPEEIFCLRLRVDLLLGYHRWAVVLVRSDTAKAAVSVLLWEPLPSARQHHTETWLANASDAPSMLEHLVLPGSQGELGVPICRRIEGRW